MYGKLSFTQYLWHLAFFSTPFCCQLMNIFFTQFWTGKLSVHKPTSHLRWEVASLICETKFVNQSVGLLMQPCEGTLLVWCGIK